MLTNPNPVPDPNPDSDPDPVPNPKPGLGGTLQREGERDREIKVNEGAESCLDGPGKAARGTANRHYYRHCPVLRFRKLTFACCMPRQALLQYLLSTESTHCLALSSSG